MKKALQVPIIRSAIQIAACINFYLCAPATAALTLASGGSIGDALKAGAFAFVQQGVWTGVGSFFDGVTGLGTAGLAATKGAVHGVVGGALSVAQGGNFREGFIANAIGAVGGTFSQGVFGNYGTGDFGNVAGRAAFSAAAGCAASSAIGGKCANGAVTAAFASLYNGDGAAIGIGGRAIGGRAIVVGAGSVLSILRASPIGVFLSVVFSPTQLGNGELERFTVRMQAQGGGLEASVTINGFGEAIRAGDGHSALTQLAKDISSTQAFARRDAFIKASKFISRAASSGGGLNPIDSRSFQADNGLHVDVEIKRGRNFTNIGRSSAVIGVTKFGN